MPPSVATRFVVLRPCAPSTTKRPPEKALYVCSRRQGRAVISAHAKGHYGGLTKRCCVLGCLSNGHACTIEGLLPGIEGDALKMKMKVGGEGGR